MEAGLAKGRAAPAWYYEEPEAEAGDDFYLAAFWELTTERAYVSGMAVAPLSIPWSAIVQYGMHHELEPDVLAAFIQILREMDAEYLGWHQRRREATK